MTTIYAKTMAYFSTGLLAFFMPITWAFIVVILFVTIDTITGVMAAGKKSVKQIQSKKLFKIVPKLIFYFLLIITAQGCTYIDEDIPFVKLAMFGVGFIEIKSIDENWEKIYKYSFINKILSAMKALSKIDRK